MTVDTKISIVNFNRDEVIFALEIGGARFRFEVDKYSITSGGPIGSVYDVFDVNNNNELIKKLGIDINKLFEVIDELYSILIKIIEKICAVEIVSEIFNGGSNNDE